MSDSEETNKSQEETKLPQKRAKKDSEGKIELSDNRFVSVSSFRGRKYVNIREFYKDESGELRPSKKGIALTPD